MTEISLVQLKAYQVQTFCLTPDLILKTPMDAVRFVNTRGFVFFWPVKGTNFPSLWTAVAGDRPVPDDHDDPGHITWSWKDSLLDQRVWYYGRVLKHKNAFISYEMLPSFYALSPNFGSPVDDIEEDYRQGHLTLESRLIFQTLLENGSLDTINLRKEAHLTGQNSGSPFNRALDQLQMDFRILPTGIADVGAWHYAFKYDLTHRVYPDLLDQARQISESQARRDLALTALRSLGAAREKDITSLFHWEPAITHRTLESLKKSGEIVPDLSLENSKDSWIGTLELINKMKVD